MKRRGFTLVELLIVIAIIGILSVVVVVAVGGAQAKSRDTKRKADIKAISMALESYKSFQSAYPKAPESDVSGCTNDRNGYTRVDKESPCVNLSNLVSKGYLSAFPVDPSQNTVVGYYYRTNGTASEYKLVKFNPEMLKGATGDSCKEISGEYFDPERPCNAYQVSSNASVTAGW
jgi:general secretion pathway protein G